MGKQESSGRGKKRFLNSGRCEFPCRESILENVYVRVLFFHSLGALPTGGSQSPSVSPSLKPLNTFNTLKYYFPFTNPAGGSRENRHFELPRRRLGTQIHLHGGNASFSPHHKSLSCCPWGAAPFTLRATWAVGSLVRIRQVWSRAYKVRQGAVNAGEYVPGSAPFPSLHLLPQGLSLPVCANHVNVFC